MTIVVRSARAFALLLSLPLIDAAGVKLVAAKDVTVTVSAAAR